MSATPQLSLEVPAPAPFLAELAARGFVADVANRPELERLLAPGAPPITVYIGFDPTADSLHLGHLVGLMTLRRFQLAGHRPIAVAGGATGMIGDPGGKSAERNLLTVDTVAANLAGIEVQLARLLDFEAGPNQARLLNNADWTRDLPLLDFLRETAKHFSINEMLAKESVQLRLKSESGLSFTEFSYSLLQARDFLHLYREHGCLLQAGGADQWGNIVAGIDLIRRTTQGVACGLTTPLLTKADGSKFGKTEGGAIWLSAARTSVYRFYQFLVQAEDGQVGQLLRYFSFRPLAELAQILAEHETAPHLRLAQKALARELTALVHGEAATLDAIRASEILFGGSLAGITPGQFAEVIAEVPSARLPESGLGTAEAGLPELLVATGLSTSKGQARKDIEAGGIYLNNERVSDAKQLVTRAQTLFGAYVLLRKGKRSYAVVNFGAV